MFSSGEKDSSNQINSLKITSQLLLGTQTANRHEISSDEHRIMKGEKNDLWVQENYERISY